jgi:putative nucleotidyltransferase with HDIG domain
VVHFFGETEVQIPGAVHFLPIGISAGLAAAAAVALTLAGARRGDARAVLIGTAFSSMAALLSIHGLTTPGFLIGDNGLVSFSGALTLPVGGAVLALSTIPELRRPTALRPVLALQAALLVVIVSLGLASILEPSFVPGVPEAASTAAYIVLGCGMVFYGALAVRAGRTYLLTRRLADLAVMYGLVLLAVALVPGLLLEYYELGWWLGHAWELIGIGLVGVPVALDLHRGAQSRPLVGDLRASELVSAADAFMGPTVRALLVRLAHKDDYTAEHTRGVALRAVQVGEELGLAPARLRELAIGGLVHDVGKLSVPNEILQKPGALTDEEYDVIKRHAELGSELVRRLGFSTQVARLVLDHHERLDGSGYPRGLGRAGSRHRDPHPGRLRRVRRALVQAGLPPRVDPREGPGADQRRVRDELRPQVCRGARARDRARAGRGRARRCLIPGSYAARSSRAIARAALLLSLPM